MYENLKALGVKRLQDLKLMADAIDLLKQGEVLYSTFATVNGTMFNATTEMLEKIKEIESKGKSIVYHVIANLYEMSDGEKIKMIDYLVLTLEDLESDSTMEKYGDSFNVFTYTWNDTFGEGEYGYIGVKPSFGGLKRIS